MADLLCWQMCGIGRASAWHNSPPAPPLFLYRSNVLLTEGGTAKLADVGLSRCLRASGPAGDPWDSSCPSEPSPLLGTFAW